MAEYRRWLLVPFPVLLGLYVLTTSRVLSLAHDGVVYLNAIQTGSQLFHPHHLLYNAFGFVCLKTTRAIDPSANGVFVLSFINSVFGALSMQMVYLLLRRRLGLDAVSAWIGALLPGLSFGVWYYSGTVEVYVVPLSFLLLAFYLLSTDSLGPGRSASVGFIHGVAILFHQMHVLFASVVIARFLVGKTLRSRRGWLCVGTYALLATVTVGIPYLIVVRLVLEPANAGELWRWLTLYGHDPSFWSSPGLAALGKTAVGFGRSIVGGHFLFSIPSVAGWLGAAFPSHWFQDEMFLVRDLPPGIGWALLGGAGMLVALLLACVGVRASEARTVWNRHPLVSLMAAVWFSVYSAFFFFWEPENLEFWIPQSVCFWLLLIALWMKGGEVRGSQRRIAVTAMAGVAALLAFINFSGSIRFTQSANNDYYYAKLVDIAERAGDRDLVVVGRHWIVGPYVERISSAEVLSLTRIFGDSSSPDEFVRQVRAAIDGTLGRGGTVFVSGEAVDLEPRALRRYGAGLAGAKRIWTSYQDRWLLVETERSRFFVIHASAP